MNLKIFVKIKINKIIARLLKMIDYNITTKKELSKLRRLQAEDIKKLKRLLYSKNCNFQIAICSKNFSFKQLLKMRNDIVTNQKLLRLKIEEFNKLMPKGNHNNIKKILKHLK